MNWRNIFTVYLKELRDTVRDRRTLLSTLVLPTVLMPCLVFSAGTVASRIIHKASAEIPTVALIGAKASPAVRTALEANPRLRLVAATDDWRTRIADKKLRAAVEIPDDFDAALERGTPALVKFYNYESELRSGLAVSELRRFFTDYRDKLVAARLRERGLSPAFVRPFELRSQNVAPPEKVGGNSIGGLIPYLFIIFCFVGAIYPAIDLTAGEKERGTLETILCSPVGRTDLVLGKFLMVLTASLATVLCSLASMGISLLLGGSLLLKNGAAVAGAMAGAMPTLDPLGVLAVVAMVLPFAMLFSALLMTIALFAKSIKEAQTYVTPLVVLVILPAMMALLPGVELNTKLALVPILNLSLVSKELVSGVWHWPHLALIFGSSCLYAAAALALCVRMFNREDVLFRA
ncbi:MAG: ABC transporter permease [Opitutae bacterium]|nr:ABC transporter permease [Opitutae bacterium]